MQGTRVTAEDLGSGHKEVAVVRDHFVIICDGEAEVTSIQSWPKNGTFQITIKGATGDKVLPDAS